MVAKKKRTVVGLGVDLTIRSTVAQLNTFEGSEQEFPGVGKVRVEQIISFQVLGTKTAAVTVLMLVEFTVLEAEVVDDFVLVVDEGNNSVPESGEVVTG